jgi:hypothetical protein
LLLDWFSDMMKQYQNNITVPWQNASNYIFCWYWSTAYVLRELDRVAHVGKIEVRIKSESGVCVSSQVVAF